MKARRTKRFLTAFVGVLFLLTMAPLAGYADVPQSINYQGLLTDSVGDPVPDDDYVMGFSIYDVATGGTALWGEAQTLTVTNGVYNVVLGQPGNLLNPAIFHGDLYLGVTVGTDDAEMTPRQRLTSTPFAMKAAKADDADTLDALDSTDFAEAAHTHPFSEITGTATDAQIPDGITINHASTADNATSANSATTAGDADTVDGQHASAFAAASHSHAGSDITSGTVADAWIAASIARDNEIMPTVLANDGTGSNLDADLLDGHDAGYFMNLGTDYGRSGVTTNLYEGTSTLTSKYVNESGDTISGNTAGWLFDVTNSGAGWGIDSSAQSFALRGTASGSSGVGVRGNANGSSGYGVYGYAGGGSGYGGFFTSNNDHNDLALGGAVGRINTDPSNQNSDLILSSNNDVMIRLDNDGGENGVFRIKNSSGSDVCTVDENGRVGIGTTSSNTKLYMDANGNYYGIRAKGASSYSIYSEWDGSSAGAAIYAKNTGTGGDAIQASANGSGRSAIAAWGSSGVEYTIYASASGADYAGYFIGDVKVQGNLEIYSGATKVMELGTGLDYAEGFDVSDRATIDSGSVLIIDPDNPGKLTLSNQPYDTKVAGIAAGANGLGSGVRLGGEQFDQDVALAGRVYCNVDATKVGVEPGDMLTTSSTPGHAMKSTNYARAHGAILGKAMQRLEKGQKGQILVLVTLQ